MASDIRLNNDSVIIEGRLGVGTDSPVAAVHVVNGQIHASGQNAALSFSSADGASGQHWRWRAADGHARLTLNHDALAVRPTTQPGKFEVVVTGSLQATRLAGEVGGPLIGQPEADAGSLDSVRCRSRALALNDPAAPVVIEGPITELGGGTGSAKTKGSGNVIDDPQTPGPLPPQQTPVPPRIALFHQFGSGADVLVINHLGRYPQGVRVDGNLTVTGAVTEASSRTVKDDIEALPTDSAMAALAELTPVTYRYRGDGSSAGQHRVGFIAEDVPDLVAHEGRDRLSPMDIVAVLTKAVQEQQRMITELSLHVTALQAGGLAP